jgi:hypothetical protein
MHNPVEVYRVERAEGAGPYFGFAILGDLRFGFSTRDQFDRWFNAAQRRELARLGFRLNTYHVDSDHVRHDDGQGECSFDKSQATLIRTDNIL